MKKNKLFPLIMLTLFMTSCSILPSLPSSEIASSSSSFNNVSSFIKNSISSNTVSQSSSIKNSTSSKNSISSNITSSSSSVSSSNKIDDSYLSSLEKLSLNYNNRIGGSYASGNWGITPLGNNKFEYYRAGQKSNNFIMLLPRNNETEEDGSFGTYNGIYGICCIDITYTTSTNAYVKYGNNNELGNIKELQSGTSIQERLIFEEDCNFFTLETGSSKLEIKEMDIYYKGGGNIPSINLYSSGSGKTRLNPVTIKTKLVSGETYVDCPIEVSVNNSNFTITKTKRYTYYSYDDLVNDSSLVEKASYTTPIDVSNYFIAFKKFPCNYYPYNDFEWDDLTITVDQAKNYFKDKFRYVSYYTRTNGYAKYVPYATGTNKYPSYYECDIDLYGTYKQGKNRGTGRVIVWLDGFSKNKGALNYNDSPVAVYTDDHYDTFQEYLNNGTFSHRFNAEYSSSTSRKTIYKYGPATTLNV